MLLLMESPGDIHWMSSNNIILIASSNVNFVGTICERGAEYFPTRWQAREKHEGFDLFFEVQPLRGEFS